MMVGMVRPVSAVMWALQVLPARKVHRVSVALLALLALLVRRVLPVPMARMVKTVRMGARWCLCTVPGAAWL